MLAVALIWGFTFWTTDAAPTQGTHWAFYPPMLIASCYSTFKWIILFLACWDSVFHRGERQGKAQWVGLIGSAMLHLAAFLLAIYSLPVDHLIFPVLSGITCLVPAPRKRILSP
jgi:hypothetical protein